MITEQLPQTTMAYSVTTPKQNEVEKESAFNIDKFMNNLTLEKAFKTGDEIPFTLEIKGDVLQANPTIVNTLKVTHDFFVRFSETDLLFSLDGEKWSEFKEAFTGSFGFSSNFAADNPVLNGHLVANIRQES